MIGRGNLRALLLGANLLVGACAGGSGGSGGHTTPAGDPGEIPMCAAPNSSETDGVPSPTQSEPGSEGADAQTTAPTPATPTSTLSDALVEEEAARGERSGAPPSRAPGELTDETRALEYRDMSLSCAIDAGDCGLSEELRDEICALSERICALQPGTAMCHDGDARCRRARARVRLACGGP